MNKKQDLPKVFKTQTGLSLQWSDGLTINSRTDTKTVIVHIPHTELNKIVRLLFKELKRGGIICSIAEKNL